MILLANNNNKNIYFTSIDYRHTSYRDKFGIPRTTQNSTCVRDDLDCYKLAKVIKKNFLQNSKVNIMPMNASDLTETYAITTALIDEFGFDKVKERFSPILATDVDKYIINKFGELGRVVLSHRDIKKMGEDNIRKYFDSAEDIRFPNLLYPEKHKKLITKPEFRALFEVKQMDLLNRLENLKDSGNSVVLIRNCLAQSFGRLHSKMIFALLGEKLEKGSLLLIGGYDRAYLPEMVDDLKDEGFLEIEKNIFYKWKPVLNDDIKGSGFKMTKHIEQSSLLSKLLYFIKRIF